MLAYLFAGDDLKDQLLPAISAVVQDRPYLSPTAESAPLSYARTQWNLGIVLFELDQKEEACQCWRRAEAIYRKEGIIERADVFLSWIRQSCEGG